MVCIKWGDDDCDELDEDRDEWVKCFYKFLKKVEVFKVVVINFLVGLWFDVRDSFEIFIDEEVEKVLNIVLILGIMDKVYEIIVDKVFNINDWLN